MNVYIVWIGNYEPNMSGIFSTLEKAESHKTYLSSLEENAYENIVIHPYPLDVPISF